MKSMTAFGRSCISHPLGRVTVEIHSVNRKHLEINTLLSKELIRFDADIKNWISQRVARGAVTVKISVFFEKESPIVITPNLPLVRQYKAAWDQIAQACGVKDSFSLDLIAKEHGIFTIQEEIADEALVRNALQEAVEAALTPFIEMKVREGAALEKDIATRLGLLKDGMRRIALFAPHAAERMRQRLRDKINEVIPGAADNEERILREVSLYAEKVDIAEEITRFESHLIQFGELLHADKDAKGKTLEFLIQELNREVNTVGSKSSELEVSRLVVDIKSELERIREQIQNIE